MTELEMTRRYARRMGGTLILEYPIPRYRRIDGIIILGGAHRIATPAERSTSLNGRDVIIVQTKTTNLGMYLAGQALFSRDLVNHYFKPKSVRTVALCGRADDTVLRRLAERRGVEVVVDGKAERA